MRINRVWNWVFGLGIFSIFLGFAEFALAQNVCGQLAAVRGRVELLRVQDVSKASGELVRYLVLGRNFVPVHCDDVILTGNDGSTRVVFENTKLAIGSDTRIEIARVREPLAGSVAKPSVSLVNLTYGKLRALVRPAPKSELEKSNSKPDPDGATKSGGSASSEPRFKVRTVSAVVGVRGTDFFTSYDMNSGVTEQATIWGKVEVEQSATQRAVVVESGQQVAVPLAQQALEVAKSEGQKGLPELASSKANEKLNVVPMSDAVKNEVRTTSAIARDDQDFVTKSAVKVLGRPTKWFIEREAVPAHFQEKKNEF